MFNRSLIVFLLTVPRCFFVAGLFWSCFGGFICCVSFVIVCSSSLLLIVPRDGFGFFFFIMAFPGYLKLYFGVLSVLVCLL